MTNPLWYAEVQAAIERLELDFNGWADGPKSELIAAATDAAVGLERARCVMIVLSQPTVRCHTVRVDAFDGGYDQERDGCVSEISRESAARYARGYAVKATAAERSRCLAIVRRVMDTTVTGSDAVYAVTRIAELIENGEPSPDPV